MRLKTFYLIAVVSYCSAASAQDFPTYNDHITSGIQEEALDNNALGAAENSTARSLARLALELIKDYEAWIPNAYNDASNYCTVGYGHLVDKWPCDRVRVKLARFDLPLSPAAGLKLLDTDTGIARATVQRLVTVDLNDEQFGALSSFVFNVGASNFESSSLLKFVNNGEFDGAALQFGRWVKSKGVVLNGLINRRSCEAALFRGTLSLRSDGRFYRDDCAALGAAPEDENLIDIDAGETGR